VGGWGLWGLGANQAQGECEREYRQGGNAASRQFEGVRESGCRWKSQRPSPVGERQGTSTFRVPGERACLSWSGEERSNDWFWCGGGPGWGGGGGRCWVRGLEQKEGFLGRPHRLESQELRKTGQVVLERVKY